MARIKLDTPAPDFTLQDYNGKPFRLSECRGGASDAGARHVLLVLNRGFT